MKLYQFKGIINKFLRDKASPAEEESLKDFERALIKKNANSVFAHTDATEVRDELSKKIVKAIAPERWRYTWVAVAASVALLLIGGVAWRLSMGELALTHKNSVAWVSVTATKGETLQVQLPDGTAVTLNAQSTLSYPSQFSEKERLVTLNGEAFFEVTKNPELPFIVKTEQLTTKVLGTSFNVEAYEEQDKVKVTLATGKVLVQTSEQQLTLLPNQQAVYQKTKKAMYAQQVDTEDFTDWKEGILHFTESSLKEVVQKLEKRYDVHIDLQVKNAEQCLLSGRFVKEDLSVVLKQLTYINEHLSYEYTDAEHIIIRGNCN